MANYKYNTFGTPNVTIPSKIVSGDTLHFQVTNYNAKTNYEGTMLTYTFPFDCKVQLEVAGARGGKGNGVGNETTLHGKGAKIIGECSFKEGDTLLICVGHAGTDSGVNTRDGSTGAGGGGTFVVQKTTSGDVYEGAGVGNGWKVTPLIIAAGGNGSRDIGYSGKGSVHHGIASTGYKPSYGAYSGGGYSTQYYKNDGTNGQCFLSGAFGGEDAFERSTSISYAGFGGGGSNRDDGEGGGGGGYYGGTIKSSATSFVDSNVTVITRQDGGNDDEGYVLITFVEVKGAKTLNARCKVGGQIKNVNNMYVKVEGNWREVFDIRFKQEGNWISP